VAEVALQSFLHPALRDPGCVERAFRVPAEYRGSTGALTMKLAVDATGKPALVHPLTPVPDAILDAASEAIRSCVWSPGGDSEGRPAALWTTLTFAIDRR